MVPFFKNVELPAGRLRLHRADLLRDRRHQQRGEPHRRRSTDWPSCRSVLVGSALGIFAYVTGNAVFAKYLLIPYIPGAGEMTVICGAMAGAGLAFLWFNAYPAQVFMGDVGALALGGALGTIAVIVRQEIVLFIMGGVFVAETAVGDARRWAASSTPRSATARAGASSAWRRCTITSRSRRRQGVPGRRPLLDRHDDAGPVRPVLAEAAPDRT
jgi:hypothetical protein